MTCCVERLAPESVTTVDPLVHSAASATPPLSEAPIEEGTYDGRTIDEIFPITGNISLIDDDGREEAATLEAGGYQVKIKDYVPQTLERAGSVLFRFRRRESGSYWATLTGTSRLLGQDSKEIYTIISGPGGVCCTNYSIVDVSHGRPKSIYDSEDFGSFRDPMEIFDADGDGVYELMQFDSCFRHFMEDCGSCSPEPRAYFRYDGTRMKYVPAAGIAQDFVRAGNRNSENWLTEKYDEYRHSKDLSLGTDIRRSALAHMVDLLFIGEELRAWQVFDKYIDDPDGKTRREVRKRLAACKFYQELKRSQSLRSFSKKVMD